MRRKRGKGKGKLKETPVVVANEPYLNIGDPQADYTALNDFDNVEIDSRINTHTSQADTERNFQEEPRLFHQDPRYKEEELKAALLVIKIAMKSDAAEPFNVPVDPVALGIPDDYDVIDTPMDFGTICKNLETGVKYMNSEDVFKDVQLIWENCSKYNKKDNYNLELMKRVKTTFMMFWSEAKLYMEQPQAVNGYSHLQPPTAFKMKQHKRSKVCPEGLSTDSLRTDNSAFHMHDKMDPSQLECHQSSLSYSRRDQPPAASNTRHAKHGPESFMSPDNDNSTCQSRDLMSPNQGQSQHPSLIYNQKHQLRQNFNQPHCSLPQPDRSSNQPQASSQQHDITSNPLQHAPRQADSSSSQSHASQLQLEVVNDITSTSKQRKSRVRGPTRCLNLCNRDGKRISITTNDMGQPVGPEAPKLTSFLGTLARDGLLAPLIYADWRAMPEANKEKMWQQVELKFEMDPICKDWVMKSLGRKWKDWKSKLKTAHYNTHETDKERIADLDERVLPDQWAILVSYWSSAEGEARSAQNKANRSQQKFSHTTGTKSFARLLEEERAKRPDGKEPSQSELFVLTRTRKDGRPVNEASAAVISKIEEHTNQQQNTLDNSQKNQDDVFSEIMGQDRHGCGRTHVINHPSDLEGANPTREEALRMVSVANLEVHEMKERMMVMEQTCAQMATQMSTMLAMMSSMQNASDKNQSDCVVDGSGASQGAQAVQQQLLCNSPSQHNLDRSKPNISEGALQPQVRSSMSISPHKARTSKKRKMQSDA